MFRNLAPDCLASACSNAQPSGGQSTEETERAGLQHKGQQTFASSVNHDFQQCRHMQGQGCMHLAPKVPAFLQADKTA